MEPFPPPPDIEPQEKDPVDPCQHFKPSLKEACVGFAAGVLLAGALLYAGLYHSGACGLGAAWR